MNTKTKSPFQAAEIEIVNILEDVITSSQKPFPGEDDEFEYYWNR